MQKIGHHVVRGSIELLSGMRIGGSDDVLQIGGTDLTCIKDPATGRPYIPGSSLKGKMRSCLEGIHNKTYKPRHENDKKLEGRAPCNCADAQCPICRVFGPHSTQSHELGPTRIIVRDAPLMGDFALETKSSTAIDRKENKALSRSLRTEERVAAGAKFAFEIGIQSFDIDESFTYPDADNNKVNGMAALKEVVEHAITLVEDTGIGAGVGKGYGQVRITIQEEKDLPARRRARRTSDSDPESDHDQQTKPPAGD